MILIKRIRKEMDKVAYIFPGQGAQYVGMGKSLYDNYDNAKTIFDMAEEALDFDIKKICFEGPSDKLSSTEYSQPAILTASIAALSVFKTVHHAMPVFSAGLSLGEYSALVASGALDIKDALRLVRLRGKLMEQASRDNPGGMLSIMSLDPGAVEDLCKSTNCYVANLNCPGQVVVSGTADNLSKIKERAAEAGAKRFYL
jgi:[acyl-carrier-protein] S-malonyltransferase